MEGAQIQQENHSTLPAEERDRWKQYLDEFVDSENHAGNATTLEGRAEEDATGGAERRSFDVAES